MLGDYKFKKNNRNVFGAKDAFTQEEDIPRFSGIKDIIKATREQNFTSPYIHEPEKVQVPDTKLVTDAPRKREADKVTQGVLRGLSSPVLSSYQELGQAGDELKQGKIGSGILDALKGTLHTVMTPITAPISAVTEGLKGTGEVGGEVAKGLEKTMQLPFDAIKYGSDVVNKALKEIGIDASDSEWSSKANELIQEVGGLYAMGKTHRSIKSYLDKKLPEIKVLAKDPEVVIKPQETTPTEGLTQEKLPTELLKPEVTEVPKVDFTEPVKPTTTRLYDVNKIAVKGILDKDPSLSGDPRLISKRLTALVEQGKLSQKVSIESIKSIAEEWKQERPKPRVQEIKATPNKLGLSIPDELNTKRAVSFDKNTGMTIQEVLEKNPEFKNYVKDITDVDKVTTELNSLYWKKRHGEKLPDPEASFDFGENNGLSPKQIMENPETTSIKNEVVNQEREYRGLEPLEKTIVRDWGKVGEDAVNKIKSGEIKPTELTKELSENPRPITDTESAVLTYDRVRIKEEHKKLLEENKPENREKILQLEEEYNLNDIASKQAGTELGRALGIRRMELNDDYTQAPLMQRARLANKGELVPEEIRVKLEEYSKQITEADAKVKGLENQLALAEAEKVLRQQTAFEERTQKRTNVKKDLDLEYEDIVKEFAKTQQLNALVDPKQIKLLVKAAKNRLQKGGLSVEQIVDQLYQDMKQYVPELTKDDILKAIGGMGRFGKTNERDIKVELKDIKRQVSDETLQKSYKTRLENRKKELEKMLETGDFEKTPRRKTPMNPELSKLKDDVDLLKLKADREIRQLELKNRTTEQKVKDSVIDIANIPRTIMSSIDLSAPLRQGVIQAFAHPKIVFGQGGAFREMFRYFKNEKNFRELQREIESSPNAVLYNKSGLYLANEKSNLGKLSGREEAYLSQLPERIPILGRGIRGSERAYTGFLDKLRMDMFDFHIENLQKSGVTFEASPKVFKDLAKMINSSTGRGTLGGFERSATALSAFLFSPRLIASRLQMINPNFYLKLDPYARKMAMKDMAKFVSVGTSILALAKLAGADVETDPRSTDFAKIKIGNTRMDVWGGFQQYGVFFSRMISNSTKQLDGEVKSLSGNEFPFRNRWDLAVRFGEQKMSPMAGFIRDAIKGQNFSGEDFELSNEALNIMTPLYIQDMVKAIEEDGIEGAFKTIPAVFGVGTQTYKTKQPDFKP